jgi:hypothetical protein
MRKINPRIEALPAWTRGYFEGAAFDLCRLNSPAISLLDCGGGLALGGFCGINYFGR